MAVTEQELTVYQGATFVTDITLTQEGAPVDLTGMTFEAPVTDKLASQHPITSFVIEVVDLLAGKIRLSLSDEVTQVLPVKSPKNFSSTTKLFFEFKMEDPEGKVYRVLQGQINVVPSVLRVD